MLASACGHTYGNNNNWQMWEPKHKPKIGANIPWYGALDLPGAFQMGHMRRLFESRPFQKLLPNQNLILIGSKEGDQKIGAAPASESPFAFIYSRYGAKFMVDKRMVKAKRVKEIWWGPR